MTTKKIKIFIITFSLLLFGISLTQTAIIINFKKVFEIPSINYFIMGSTAILGGGLLEWVIWLANPLSLLTIIFLYKNNNLAIKTSLIALLLSSSFRLWKEIIGAESGSMAKIISFEKGYYLWVASIFILTIGVFVNSKHYKKTIND